MKKYSLYNRLDSRLLLVFKKSLFSFYSYEILDLSCLRPTFPVQYEILIIRHTTPVSNVYSFIVCYVIDSVSVRWLDWWQFLNPLTGLVYDWSLESRPVRTTE